MTSQTITTSEFLARYTDILKGALANSSTFYLLTDGSKTYHLMNEQLLASYLSNTVKMQLSKTYSSIHPIERFIDAALEDVSYIRAQELTLDAFERSKETTINDLLDERFEILYIDTNETSIIILESSLIELKIESIIAQYHIFYPETVTQEITQAQRSLLKIAERIHVFDGIDANDILAITKDVIFLRFEENETIFKQASDGQNMYYILSGAIEILHNELNAPRKIATLVHDELFGEIAPILSQPRSTAAVALKQSTLLSFEIDKSKKLSYPEAFITLYENFIATLSKKILKSNHQLLATHS